MKRLIQKVMSCFAGGQKNRQKSSFEVQRELVTALEPVIFDVGAHVGRIAKVYRSHFPQARIHCFEPFPDSFQCLSQGMKEDVRTICHPEALSSQEGTLVLHSNAKSATNSLLPTDERADALWGAGLLDTKSRLEVRTTTVDTFCSQEGILDIDILKLDVQGAEYSVLQGAKGMLERQRISLIYLELILCPTYQGQHKLQDYLSLLDAHGYELLDFFAPVRRNHQLLQSDAIFISGPFRKSLPSL